MRQTCGRPAWRRENFPHPDEVGPQDRPDMEYLKLGICHFHLWASHLSLAWQVQWHFEFSTMPRNCLLRVGGSDVIVSLLI